MLKQFGEKLPDGRWLSAPAERNKGPILEVLERVLPQTGVVLEIGSGTGQHVMHFAAALPQLTWQPSDPDAEFRASAAHWAAAAGLANVNAGVELDVLRKPWPLSLADAVICVNMIHVAPWAATPALVEGAGSLLPGGGILFLYGPYRRFGRHTAPSNEAFDARLRSQNPEWGIRDLEEVARLAGEAGMEMDEVVEMPANNFSVVFRKRGGTRI